MRLDIVNKDEKTVYNIKFRNLTDLNDYLLSNPPVNTKIFDRLASQEGKEDFAGEPLKKAITQCIGGTSEGLSNFLVANSLLKKADLDIDDRRKTVRSIHGGIPYAPLVASGVPDCMIKHIYDESAVVRNIYFNLSYMATTNQSQIVNRGLAALYIIQALEERGEMIDLHAFQLSKKCDEIVNIDIGLKKPGDLFLDVSKCYFPFTRKEFLRRMMFRVLESAPVKEMWGEGYGGPLTEEGIRNFYNVKPSDIIIYEPTYMGIEGYDIYDDTVTMINSLGLQDEFDTEKIKKIGEMKRK